MPTRHLFSPDYISVLVADDDPVFRGLVVARLERMNGHAVEAADGVAAWSQLTTQQFDVALVDLNMPGLDGIGLIQCMRGYAYTRHMPIVVMTANDDAETISAALSAGATAFLTKPINWQLFENHLNLIHSTARAERKQRTSMQLMKATNRAKHVIVDALSAQVRTSTLQARARLQDLSILPVGSLMVSDTVDELLEDLDRLAAASKRASHFASILSHDIDASDQTVLLADLIGELIQAVSPEAEAKSNTIRIHSEVPHAHVRCDKDSVQLAIGELLNNALTHALPGQAVEVSTRRYPDGMLAVEIKDNGCGMHPETVARILGALDPSGLNHLAQAEIGFGLPLAKAIAQAHGGELEVRSMTGRGTSALFLLPPDRVRFPAGQN